MVYLENGGLGIFGFDGDEEGLRQILYKISTNEKSLKLTHKEVRAYARCLLALLPQITVCLKNRAQISTLLAAMSLSEVPHYDRSFLAQRILKLIDDTEVDLLESVSGDDVGF